MIVAEVCEGLKFVEGARVSLRVAFFVGSDVSVLIGGDEDAFSGVCLQEGTIEGLFLVAECNDWNCVIVTRPRLNELSSPRHVKHVCKHYEASLLI